MPTAEANPYRVDRLHALTPRLDESLTELVERFAALGRRAVIVGPHGSGKTTLLEALAPQLGAVTWLRLRRDAVHNRSVLRALPPRITGTLLLDGLEQLGPLGWWQVRRRASAILATSHRRGRLPLLRRQSTSPALLAELVRDLGEAPPDDLISLFARQHGDVRACLRELYDRQARLPAAPAASAAATAASASATASEAPSAAGR